ncbi:hypothetical protein ES702_03575 [subsurface metagenome]
MVSQKAALEQGKKVVIIKQMMLLDESVPTGCDKSSGDGQRLMFLTSAQAGPLGNP